MPVSRTLLLFGAAVLFSSASLFSGEAPAPRNAIPIATEPEWPAPSAETAAFLATVPIPAKSPSASMARRDLADGDEVFFLMTVRSAKKSRQYLASIRAETAGGKEMQGFTMEPFTMFTNTGHRIDYGVRPVALVITITGPIEGKKAPQVRTSRLVANEEFLSQGFCDACTAFETLSNLKNREGSASFGIAMQPFPEVEAAENLEKLLALGIVPSAEQERALGGIMPALFSFLDLVMRTEGMTDMVEELAAPSLAHSLSMAIGTGNVSFNIQTDKLAHLPPASDGSPRWTMPVTLSMSGADCIVLDLCARPATAPFSACAGIDAVMARSVRKPDRVLTLQLLGARLSSESESSSPDKTE